MIPEILCGYTDRLSYEPGARIKLCLSSPSPETANIQLVRLERAFDSDGDSSGVPVSWSAAGKYNIEGQSGTYGGFAVGAVSNVDFGNAPSFGAFIWLNSDPGETSQVVVALESDERVASIELRGSRVLFRQELKDGTSVEAIVSESLAPNCWYLVAASYLNGRVDLRLEPREEGFGKPGFASVGVPSTPTGFQQIVIGAASPEWWETKNSQRVGRAARSFTGKISRPFVASHEVSDEITSQLLRGRVPGEVFNDHTVATWDFSPKSVEDANCNRIQAEGGLDLEVINLPTRCATGPFWAGAERFTDFPSQFDAIHFHSTDMVDADWSPVLDARLPENLESGLYGLRVETPQSTDTVPFTVLPIPSGTSNRVLVILPTFTYIAYGNESLFVGMNPELTGASTDITDSDQAHVGNPTFGLCFYDRHSDGAGVSVSASARPLVNMRHDYKMWLSASGRGLSGDMYLIEWLVSQGIKFDLITDFELHQGGVQWLKDYDVAITGAHPEYYSGEMLDALHQYRDNGGRIMYLGGNGFYWVTGVVSSEPLTLEIKRGVAGVAEWKSQPGELFLTSTGEQGGLWRFRGRAPQRLVGIGMAAQGWGESSPFFRQPGTEDPEVAWIFEGIEDGPLGDFGRVMGGASGDEIDRLDYALGTPPETVLLASSRGHSRHYQRVIEEVGYILPGAHGGDTDPDVRGDIVYLKLPNGGEVFSAGSIAYSGALLHNGGDNPISRMTRNVLNRFTSSK